MKKILIITPKFPYPAYGACEQDRFDGIKLFLEMGYQVQVITKIYSDNYKKDVEEIEKKLGIKIIPLIYKNLSNSFLQKINLKRFLNFGYLDGATFEYVDKEMQNILKNSLEDFKPNFVWFDYTYLWPLYKIVKKKNIPIITRSINFEPDHFLEESGRSLKNYIKYLPKLYSEYIVSKKSDVLFAITPDEEKKYKKIGAKSIKVLPLRGLSKLFDWKIQAKENKPLNVFFSGSTYNVAHNRLALEFLIKKIAPLAEKKYQNKFIFHIFGGKVPADLEKYFNNKIVKREYVPSSIFKEEILKMDIALIPHIAGCGMQQKIFEPLSLGFPVITSACGLAGYPFEDKKHLLFAETPDDYVDRLNRLRDIKLRNSLGEEARILSNLLFSKQNIIKLINNYL